MDVMDEKEEGEISLEDVSSSDEGQSNYPMAWMHSSARSPTRKTHQDREVAINPKDAGYGKENRHYSREIIGSRYTFTTLQEKNDDLLPISSDDEIEAVGVPGSSHQLHIRVGKKKRKKKKKKKNGGNDVILIDDYVSTTEPDPIILNGQKSRFDSAEIIVHRRRRSPSPRLPPRRHSPCARTRAISRSPPRSPLRTYRPAFRGRSPSPRNRYSRSPSPRRRSPRRLRSPRKSPVISSRDKSPRRTCSHSSPDRYASSLLKKVRQLDTVGTGSTVSRSHKEQGSSLKDKLSNIFKEKTEVKNSVDVIKTKMIKSEEEVISDHQEEEDLELLRKQALQTKQQKTDKATEQSKNSSGELEHLSDDDNEDLELRMIALRSAVMKKHQKRVKGGATKKMRESTRDMSPLFADSFLNDLGETDEENQSESLPSTSPTNQVEDMDLDTDVEREKENYLEPYSPTDEVMRNTPEENYPENQLINGSCKDNDDNVNLEAPYSPSDPTKTPWVDRFKKSVNISPLKDVKTIIQTNLMKPDADNNEEAPYSPSDTPVYDPEFPYSPIELLEPQNDNNCTVLDLSIKEVVKEVAIVVKPISPLKNENKPKGLPAVPLKEPSVSPSKSLITIDERKGSQDKEKKSNHSEESEKSKITEKHGDNKTAKNNSGATKEPLYLQGVPDVTKDANKIPTLVNRSLVPVSILKTNKKLQQPLPQKKLENHSEPAFKSAEMQPVDMVTQPVKSNAGFKPIKLQPVTKKPAVVAPAAAFNSSLTEETNVETSENDIILTEGKDSNENSKVNENENSQCHEDGKNASHDEVLQSGGKKGKRKRGSRARKAQRRRSALANILNNSEANSTLDESMIEKENHTSDKSEKLSNLPTEKSCEDANLKRNENKSTAPPNCNAQRDDKNSNSKVNEKDAEKNSEPKVNDHKKRRNSIEEDEETLRAILIASLAKRPKTNESTAQKTSENVLNPPEINSKASQVTSIEDKDKVSAIATKPTLLKPTPLVQPHAQPSEIVTREKSTPSTTTKPIPSLPSTVQLSQKASATVIEAKKRLNPSIIKGPPKKIVKKVSIPVSTKVVNNAKKFQNIMMQRKLLHNKLKHMASTSRNLSLNNVKVNETPAPMSPKTTGNGKVQRLVINLGEDTDSDSEEDRETDEIRPATLHEPRVELSIPTTDFEKSVDQFLKDQRKKQESMATSNPVTSTPTSARVSPVVLKKSTGLSATPLAVRHLPLLQQEEYKRLKQKILEKERQQASRQKSSLTPPSPVSPASPIAKINKPAVKSPSTLTKTNDSENSEAKVPVNNTKGSLQTTAKTVNNSSMETSVLQDKSLSSTPTAVQPMTNLSIQIPNDHSPNGVRIVSNKQDNIEQTTANSVPALRILTREQVNMKFVQVQLKHGEENRTVIVSEGLPINTGINVNSGTNNCMNAENNQAEMSLNETEKLAVNNQTSHDNDVASETVDSEASTVILPPRIDGNETAEGSRNETGDTTIVLDDTIEERNATPIRKSPKKSRNSKSPVKEHSEKIKSDVKSEMECFVLLSEAEQKNRLVEMEENLVTKRYAVLEDLSEMSGTLQQWDMERELQTNLVAEVKRLRLQLAMAEERLKEQRVKIEEISPKVTEAHKTIVNGRTECLKLTKLCQGFGIKVVGPQYKVPIAGAQLMMEKLKEVAYHTRQLSKKKVPYVNNNEEPGTQAGNIVVVNVDSDCSTGEQSDGNADHVNSDAEQSDNSIGVVISRSVEELPSTDVLNNNRIKPGSSSTPSISGANQRSLNVTESSKSRESNDKAEEKQTHRAKPYESVLSHFGTPRHIDMHRALCPFELTGICKDDSCLYNHLDPTRKQ